jgi:hypothetical protein
MEIAGLAADDWLAKVLGAAARRKRLGRFSDVSEAELHGRFWPLLGELADRNLFREAHEQDEAALARLDPQRS